jgi:2-polyprenyl-6-methoxyphenol hydroxylase-like FAD-dependent oxidoreductase
MTTRSADIAIVGAGLAGSLAALLLGRQGIAVTVIDPYTTYPADFRCEKLTAVQLKRVEDLDLCDVLLPAMSVVRDVAVARAGRLVDLRTTREVCARYDTMVNAVRAAWPACVAFHEGRVASLSAGTGSPALRLNCGLTLDPRLTILATGPGEKLRASLAMRRRMVRENQSICIGFDLMTANGCPLSPRAMTYYGERAGDGIAFATLFPFPATGDPSRPGGTTRCNFFCYLDPKSSLIRGFRDAPLVSLYRALPGLAHLLLDVKVVSPVEIRITDLYEIDDPARCGVVLIGDAQHSSCPVTGTGVSRVLTDVERLCHTYVPRWLATPGMEAAKIAEFYADPVKRAVDAHAARKAERDRAMALDTSWTWRGRRAAAVAKSRVHHAVTSGGAPVTYR